jgi:plasmid maintenance system antidote protein VapI
MIKAASSNAAFDLQAWSSHLNIAITNQLAPTVAIMSNSPQDMWKNLQKSLEQAQKSGRKCAYIQPSTAT